MTTENTKKTTKKELSAQSKMVTGSVWMTVGSISSRLLGLLYIIPWMAWMGNKETADAANALFQIAYAPYAFSLSLATAGVPSAISKQVSYYNALGDYETSKLIYKKGMQLMAVTGVVAAIFMYLLAPLIAQGSPTVSAENTTTVIRSLTPALAMIPMMSVTRGFIQGHNTMAPSAISQVIEQAARVVFMLLSVYIVRIVLGGSVTVAVSLSTFAAFIGAVFAFGYLLNHLKKNSPVLNVEIDQEKVESKISTNQLLINIIKTAIPFIVIATGITVFQFVDQFTYEPIMERVSDLSAIDIQRTYGISQANAHKLIMVIISFGAAMAIASVPLISDLMAKGNMKEVSRQFSNGVQLLFLVMLPASVGMAVLAGPIYSVVYGYDAFGSSITMVSAYMSIFLSLYSLLGNSLQAANQTRPAIYSLAAGVVTKIVTQYPMISMFSTFGMLASNMLGFTVTCLLMMHMIHKTIGFNRQLLFRRILLMTILTAIMGIGTTLTRNGLMLFLNQESRMQSLVIIAITAVVGVLIYGFLILKTNLADRLLGSRVANIRRKLKI